MNRIEPADVDEQSELLVVPGIPEHIAAEHMHGLLSDDLVSVRARSALSHTAQTAPQTMRLMSEDDIELIRTSIRNLADVHGFPDPLARQGWQRFDRALGTRLLEVITVPPKLAAESSMWRFLSCVVLPELSMWRFDGGATHSSRFLGGDRDLLRSRWWRAWSLGPDLTLAPAGCEPLGEDEFTSIMERPTIGYSPRLAGAIRDAVWRHELELNGSRMMFVRALAARVISERQFRNFDVLDSDELAMELDRMAVQIHAAMRDARAVAS